MGWFWCAVAREAHDGVARAVPWSALEREKLVAHRPARGAAPRGGEEFYEQSVHERSWAVVRDGAITALADLYDDPVGPRREGSLEAVDAAAPHARADVALCLAAMLERLRALGVLSLDLDNHPTDPHAAPLLATLRRTEVDPVRLVEIPNGLTAQLRDVP